MTITDAIKYARENTYHDGNYASYHSPQYGALMAHTYPNARYARGVIRTARIMLALYAMGWTPEEAQAAANHDAVSGRGGDWILVVQNELKRAAWRAA